ncbi:hypothetical protein FRB90_001015 [Tulasnella sp. 427]|nr:hypothetical protein FRB90_001015 [Tulasnella sp. 427]
MALPSKRALPAKETALFKSLLQLYETRQYKKALKVADQILKKAPKHGETTSMKGLVLTNLNKKEEGIQLVKAGITLDIDSHICWHVYGIVHKADRNYEEALKCYLQALKFDKDNINILRDSAQLQAQLRQYEALQETRLSLLRLRPNVRLGWVGLAVAYHLNNKIPEARTVLQQYLKTVKGVPDYDFEFSELLTYYVTLVEDVGENSEALQLLEGYAKDRSIVDKMAIMTIKARLLQKLGRSDEAIEAYDCLLAQNPESFEYYRGYFLAKGIDLENISEETRPKVLKVFEALAEALPKATGPRRLALDVASGDSFKAIAEAYLQSGLVRGIPSLFADVKALYRDAEKRDAMGDIALQFSSRLGEALASPSSSKSEYDPTTYVWSLYFLAQHHSYISPTSPETALNFINKALEHTPTLPELYMAKARILKRAGDPIGASQAMEDARAVGKLSMALKRYRTVEKTFNDFEDDQYDFHSYCLRRHTLNAYHGLLRFEDSLRLHPAYVESALAAAQIYLEIHDGGSKVIAAASSAVGDGQKKGKKKAKKADKEKKVTAQVPSQVNDDKEAPPAPPVDDDPDGLKLLNSPKPLEDAVKLLRPLEDLRPTDMRVWSMSFDLSLRRGKYLQALRALRAMQSLQANDPDLHYRAIHLRLVGSSLAEPSRSVLSKGLNELAPADVPLGEMNTQFLQRNPGSGAALYSYCRALWAINGQDVVSDVEESIMQMVRPELVSSIKVALQALEFLRDTIHSSRAEDFRQGLANRFPISTVFRTEPEKANIRASLRPQSPLIEEPEHE